MKNARMAVLVMVVVMFMATKQGFGIIEYKDGLPHNVSSLIPDDVWVDYQAPGIQTTVNVLDKGGFTNPGTTYFWGKLKGYNDSRINISGGYVDRLDTYNSTTVNLSGGNISKLNAWNSTTVNILPYSLVNGPFIIRDNSSVDISGGFFAGTLNALETSSIVITGGNFRSDHTVYLAAAGDSTVDISGGFVNSLLANGSSEVNISGGRVMQLSANENSTTIFHGYDFTGTDSISFDGDKVLGTGRLSGKWLDGTSWTTDMYDHDAGATILAVPEPCTLALIGLGGLLLRRRRR